VTLIPAIRHEGPWKGPILQVVDGKGRAVKRGVQQTRLQNYNLTWDGACLQRALKGRSTHKQTVDKLFVNLAKLAPHNSH